MFRMEEVILGGWREKTIDAMRRRRFEVLVSRLQPLGSQRLEMLPQREFWRRLELCWQDIERKPIRTQQLSTVRKSVLSSVTRHADCLSKEEHSLVERALILGGSVWIQDAQELEAAHALSLRLWGHVGLVSQRPCFELEHEIMEPAAKALARDEHEEIRARFEAFTRKLSALLYCYGAMDDRIPQQRIVREVLGNGDEKEAMSALARKYLWSSFDCIDYGGNVVLLHSALADPYDLLTAGRRMSNECIQAGLIHRDGEDILSEEIPLQETLERAIRDVVRPGMHEKDIVRDLRFLCKQGAPLNALEEVLQSCLIVFLTPAMRRALRDIYYTMPKWIDSVKGAAFQ